MLVEVPLLLRPTRMHEVQGFQSTAQVEWLLVSMHWENGGQTREEIDQIEIKMKVDGVGGGGTGSSHSHTHYTLYTHAHTVLGELLSWL